MKSTYTAYWERCERLNMNIVGNITRVCDYRNGLFWTGLRRFKIDSANSENTCYILEMRNGIWGYKEKNCARSHHFICKQDIAYSPGQIQSTKNTASQFLNLDTLPTTNIHETDPTTKRSISTTRPPPSHVTTWKLSKSDVPTIQIITISTSITPISKSSNAEHKQDIIRELF